MRSLQVVVVPAFFDYLPGFSKVSEPVLVQTIVSELTVETLTVGVLSGLSWLDKAEFHPSLLAPEEHRLARHLWPIVHHNALR